MEHTYGHAIAVAMGTLPYCSYWASETTLILQPITSLISCVHGFSHTVGVHTNSGSILTALWSHYIKVHKSGPWLMNVLIKCHLGFLEVKKEFTKRTVTLQLSSWKIFLTPNGSISESTLAPSISTSVIATSLHAIQSYMYCCILKVMGYKGIQSFNVHECYYSN